MPKRSGRYDRTLRVVMWSDAFLSAALAVVCVLVSPILAIVAVPAGVLSAIGVTTAVLAVLLAGFGAVTAVAFTRRLHAGDYEMPARLNLPLPAGMRPKVTSE